MAGAGPAISNGGFTARRSAVLSQRSLAGFAFRAEFLALFAMQALGVGFLRTFDRLGGMRDRGGGRLGRRGGGSGGRIGEGGAHEERRHSGGGEERGDLHD
jgi:hypothetical protein